MRRWLALIAVVVATNCALSLPIQASVLHYEVSGSANFSFNLDGNPSATPDATFPGSFYLTNIANTSATNPFPFLYFFDELNGGAFAASTKADASGNLVSFFGEQLFSGNVSAPILLTGTFSLYNVATGNFDASVVVTDVPAAVPLPSTWTLMILGFAGLSFMARYRKRAGVAAMEAA